MATYRVALNDTPASIAMKLGHQGRAADLIAANPQKPSMIIDGLKTFRQMHINELLALPASWGARGSVAGVPQGLGAGKFVCHYAGDYKVCVQQLGPGEKNIAGVGAARIASVLPSGQQLSRNQALTSQNGQYHAILQNDGNFVVYAATPTSVVGWVPIWWTNTIGGFAAVRASMQADGNFVLYTAQGVPVWNTDTQGNGRCFLIMQNDGNLVLYNASNVALWSSRGGRINGVPRGVGRGLGDVNSDAAAIVALDPTTLCTPGNATIMAFQTDYTAADLGTALTVDGNYGSATQAALQQVLSATGGAGGTAPAACPAFATGGGTVTQAQVIAAANALIADSNLCMGGAQPPASNANVAAFQTAINGYQNSGLTVDGEYGPATFAALTGFAGMSGVTLSGTVPQACPNFTPGAPGTTATTGGGSTSTSSSSSTTTPILIGIVAIAAGVGAFYYLNQQKKGGASKTAAASKTAPKIAPKATAAHPALPAHAQHARVHTARHTPTHARHAAHRR
jgi:hypothetical protein